MRFLLHCSCLLLFSLVAPISLPAGGGIRNKAEVISHERTKICLAGDSCKIFSSPFRSSSTLRTIALGTPMRIIRVWYSDKGTRWLQVKLGTCDFVQLPSSTASRGWINV